jgi:hypothetical protein
MRAQARFHPNGARRQPLERIFEAQSPDLPAKGDPPVGAQSNEVKNLLPMSTPTTAKVAMLVSVFGFIVASPVQRRSP